MKEKFEEINPTVKVTIVLVVIFLILAIIVLLSSGKKETKHFTTENFNKVSSTEIKDFDTFLVVENHLNRFFSLNNAEYLYYSLDKDYIEKYNITKENVVKNLGFEDKDLSFKVSKVYKLTIGDVIGYYAEGILFNNNEGIDVDSESDLITIINKKYGVFLFIDYENLSFSVYPDLSHSDTLNLVNNKSTFSVERNQYNKIVKSTMATKLEICKRYYSDLIFKINNMPEDLYDYLDNSDKNNFKDRKEFKEYIDKYYSSYIYSFKSCDQGNSSKDYYLNDEKNTFKIKINGLMNYTVDLP